MGDPSRDEYHFARLHLVNAELGFHGAFAAKLKIDHVRVDVAVEAILNTDDAVDADPMIFVLKDH